MTAARENSCAAAPGSAWGLSRPSVESVGAAEACVISVTGFTEELQAEAAGIQGKLLLVPLEILYGAPS
jgi:hypothetical protein